jgi:cytochrome P450
LLDFFVAGTQTVALLSQQLLHQMAFDKEVAEKVRSEINTCLLKPAETSNLFEAMTYDRIFEMKYFAMLFQEGLRFMPVAPSTSIFEVTQDLKIGNI